jgi:hypothetical protein
MIDDIIKKLSSAVIVRNHNASHVKMMLKTAKMARANEILTLDQLRKFDWIVDELTYQLTDLIEIEKIKEEIKKENGLETQKDITKSIIRWSLCITDAVNKPPKPQKEAITSLKNAAINDEAFNLMILQLLNKKVIDDENTLIGTATLLYSLIRRFYKLGKFKKIALKDLFPFINAEFKMNASFQTFTQAGYYTLTLG